MGIFTHAVPGPSGSHVPNAFSQHSFMHLKILTWNSSAMKIGNAAKDLMSRQHQDLKIFLVMEKGGDYSSERHSLRCKRPQASMSHCYPD